jgi:hypothetical protein
MNEKQKKEVAALFLKLGIIGFEVRCPHLYDARKW